MHKLIHIATCLIIVTYKISITLMLIQPVTSYDKLLAAATRDATIFQYIDTTTVPLTLNLTHACVCTRACTRLTRVKVNN